MKRKRLAVGDVFVIPAGDGRAAIGQVVARYLRDAWYFAIFEGVFPESECEASIPTALASPIQFLALSLDAKIYVGHWTVIGHAEVRPDVPFPAYKVSIGTPDHVDVEDYSGTRSRRATKREVHQLPNRKTFAPAILEHAVKAGLGLEPWESRYEELRPLGVTSREVFG